jgi:hypothetical protein
MSDTTLTPDQQELATDAQFSDMLQRVSFQPGVMLGAEALTAEQTYHLRRLTRHQRWLAGPGTIFGLRVDVLNPAPASDPTDVRITVAPGYAIDGLGRDVLVGQAYAISLRDWLKAEAGGPAVAASYAGTTLYLRVTVRVQACPLSLQPVVAELFDAGLDPVVPARIGDSFLLELTGDQNQLGDVPAHPLDWWTPGRATPTAANVAAATASAREQATLAGLAASPAVANALKLQNWLLGQPLPAYDDSPGADAGYQEAARLLLASVHVSLPSLTTAPTIAGTAVNNLVRPFVSPNLLLTPLPLP